MKIKDAVDKYIRLRDKIDAIRDEQRAQLRPYVEAKLKLESALLAHLNSHGADNIKTSAGTAYRSLRTNATIADWDMFLDYLKESGAYHLMERRASNTAVKEFLDEEGELPPGLNFKSEYTVNVRRSS